MHLNRLLTALICLGTLILLTRLSPSVKPSYDKQITPLSEGGAIARQLAPKTRLDE
ncbi:MAG: hypothetical protein AAFX01_11155 [Cyanobacteria bacterium J06638_28]